MKRLIDMAAERTDGEPLLSAVFASFQTRPAKSPFVQWTNSNAGKFVAPMNSGVLRARHALLGITAFTSSAWKAWAKHLPAPGDSVDQSIQTLASAVVLDHLLPAFAKGHEPLTEAELADLLVRVSAWAQLAENQIAVAVESVMKELPWDGDKRPWPARAALYSAIYKSTVLESGDGPVSTLIGTDLTAALTTVTVDEDMVDKFVDIVTELPGTTRAHLADRVAEEYQPTESEGAEGLRLRLELRRLTGRDAVAADELLAVEDPSTKTVDAWLALNPSAAEVEKIVGMRQGTIHAMSTYAGSLGTEERTGLWVAADIASVSDGLLHAIGQRGVSSAAVEHCRRVVAGHTQQGERKAAVARLCTATPAEGSNHAVAALRRAAAELATNLLGQSGGDLRTAADLMVWAGGSSPRGRADLRELFDREAAAHSNVLTKSLVGELQGLNLLSRKKSWLEKFLDR